MPFPASILVKDLNVTHREVERYQACWDRLTWLYEGGQSVKDHASEILLRRSKEPEDTYKERVKCMSYVSVIGQALGWYESTLFGDNPVVRRLVGDEEQTEGPAQDRFNAFLADCDMAGTPFIDFVRQLVVDELLYGRSYVLIDKPKTAVNAESRADEIASRPYLVRYDPRCVIDWEEDDHGALLWVLVRVQNTERSEEFPHPAKPVDRWLYYSRNEYAFYRREYDEAGRPKEDAYLEDEGIHALAPVGVVPIIRTLVKAGLWISHRAWLTAEKHVNMENAHDWSLLNSALAVLTITGEVDNPTISEVAYLQLKTGSTASYLEPGGVSFGALETRTSGLREDVFRQMYLLAQARTTDATPAAQSGISKEADATPAYEVCQSMGKLIVSLMQTILANVCWMNQDLESTIEITGFDFEQSDIVGALDVFGKLMGMDIPSPTLEKQVYKRAWRTGIPDMDRIVAQQIDSEIEAAPSREEREAEKQAARIKAITGLAGMAV